MPIEMMATVEFEARCWNEQDGQWIRGTRPSKVKFQKPKDFDPGIEDYLEEHLDHLRARWHAEEMLRASFRVMEDGEQVFKDLQVCDTSRKFGTLSKQIAQRIWDKSDMRVSNGVVVVIRRSRSPKKWKKGDLEKEIAVLKLDLHNPAAHLSHVPDPHLESVEDALDLPDGPLPKAAVYPDDHNQGTVMVVAEHGMVYMLDAIGAQIFKRDEQGVARLEDMVREVVARTRPDKRDEIVEDVCETITEMERIELAQRDEHGVAEQGAASKPEFSPDQVITAMGSLNPVEHDRVTTKLVDSAISAERLTAPERTKRIRDDGLEFHYPARMLVTRKVTIDPDPQGGWLITIRTNEDPRL